METKRNYALIGIATAMQDYVYRLQYAGKEGCGLDATALIADIADLYIAVRDELSHITEENR